MPDSNSSRIRQHSRELVRELDVVNGVYMGTGFTISQCHVLYELSHRNSLTLMELAEILLIDKSNTSRTLKKLVTLGLVQSKKGTTDSRQKWFRLTPEGEKALNATVTLADRQVEKAIENLSQDQQTVVIEGMQLYANAMRKSRLQAAYSIRPIQKQDNIQVARVIRDVLTEFRAVGEGYSIVDAEIDNMYGGYRNRQSCYFVILGDEQVVGGGGLAPLEGGKKTTCELRKMFFTSATRGMGLGRRLLLMLLDEARKRGYRNCYLETLDRMWAANELYQKNGFELLDRPLGSTGHCRCDRWYQRTL